MQFFNITPCGFNIRPCKFVRQKIHYMLVALYYRPHHILEIVISGVFKHTFGNSFGPNISIFEDLKKQWPTIKKQVFKVLIKNITPTLYK